MQRYIHFWLIVLVMLLAGALRISGAGHNSTWSDEGWNYWLIEDGDTALIFDRLADNHHPPLYFLSLSTWRDIAGESKTALRFLSVAAGMLTLALIIRTGIDTFGWTSGIIAGLLFAVFEQSIYYGQNVRHYGYLTLGVAISIFMLMRIFKRPKATVFYIGYACGVAFTLYSMYLGVAIIAVQGFTGLLLWSGTLRQKGKLMLSYLGALVLVAPWLIYALPRQWHKVEVGVIGGYHNSFESTLHDILRMFDLITGGEFVIGAGLSALAIRALWTKRKSTDTAQILIVLTGIGAFVGLIAGNLIVGILSERTLYMLVPSIVLLMGYGFRQIQAPARGILLFALIGWLLVTPQNAVPHINSDIVAQTIADGYNTGDFILLETGFDDAAFAYEISQTLSETDTRVFRSYYEYDYPDDNAMMLDLDAELADEQRVWLVYWNVPPRLADKLSEQGFTSQSHIEIPMGENDPLYTQYPIVTVDLFTRPNPESEAHIFGDLFVLEDVYMSDLISTENTLYVDLWWSAQTALDRDYSVGVFLRNAEGVTIAESNTPPSDMPTTQWQADTLYYDRHALSLPDNLPDGEYTVIVNVYWYQEPEPLPVNGEPFAIIGRVTKETTP